MNGFALRFDCSLSFASSAFIRRACSSTSRASNSALKESREHPSVSGLPFGSLFGEDFETPSQNLEAIRQWCSSSGVLQPEHLATRLSGRVSDASCSEVLLPDITNRTKLAIV